MTPPGAPKATRDQRQLQVAEMRIQEAIAQKQSVDYRDLLVVMRHTMTHIYPSAEGRLDGTLAHVTEAQWEALDEEFERDTVPKLARLMAESP